MSGETEIVAFHWYSGFELTVMAILEAVVTLAVQFPGGPHCRLPVRTEPVGRPVDRDR